MVLSSRIFCVELGQIQIVISVALLTRANDLFCNILYPAVIEENNLRHQY